MNSFQNILLNILIILIGLFSIVITILAFIQLISIEGCNTKSFCGSKGYTYDHISISNIFNFDNLHIYCLDNGLERKYEINRHTLEEI